jgi:hypothetical protein
MTADANGALDALEDGEEDPVVAELEPTGRRWKDRAARREDYLRRLDEPKHALEHGGISGQATIPGMPTGSPGRHGEAGGHHRRLGIVSEPVPVLMRDAVTIDTAVRLTGVQRVTLQRAALDGRLPVLKLGPGREPYLVRLRDVVTYLATMWTTGRARAEQAAGGFEYVGFPNWLVEQVADRWPSGELFEPSMLGKWEPRKATINRGGRPQGYSPGRGWTKAGKRLGRPPKPRPPATSATEEKRGAPEHDHVQATPVAAAALQGEAQPTIDPTTLPKWHPLWRRPQEE